MRAIDTNVLVRLIARDDKKQLAAAEEFVTKGVWVSHLVLAETVWVLRTVYQKSAEELAEAIEMLLAQQQVSLQDEEVVAEALQHFRRKPALGFTDCLVLETARKAGHLPLGTFDRDLSRLDDAERL
jgi:predicted nucleic-acid-binding protein